MTKGQLNLGYVEREIFPESMWPGLTVDNQTARSWQAHEARAKRKYVKTNQGTWVPHPDFAAEDLAGVTHLVERSAAADVLMDDERFERAANMLGEVTVGAAYGCWEPEQTPTSADISAVSELDVAREVLEPEELFDDLRQCGTPDCIYPRHFDFTYNVPSGRRELIAPQVELFKATDSGVYTAWGDVLPTIEESRQSLIEFQQKCRPNVGRKESLLTLGGISQITFIPETGCWFNRAYYMTPVNAEGFENWQYDGYGRLRIPSLVAEKFGRNKSFAELGHRVVWLLHENELPSPKEKVLNHMCGFRPCCNPGHMELVTPSENVHHGVRMGTASTGQQTLL